APPVEGPAAVREPPPGPSIAPRILAVADTEEPAAATENTATEPEPSEADKAEGGGWVPLRANWRPSSQTWGPLAESWQRVRQELTRPEPPQSDEPAPVAPPLAEPQEPPRQTAPVDPIQEPP